MADATPIKKNVLYEIERLKLQFCAPSFKTRIYRDAVELLQLQSCLSVYLFYIYRFGYCL